MKSFLYLIFSLALTALATTTANASDTAPGKLASAQYLVGTWNCRHTVGSFSGTYTTTYANALDGKWLRQTYDFPATAGGPAMRAEYFIGYDDRHEGWVRFGVMTTGQYFAIRMTDTGDGAWSWKYISFFTPKQAETPNADAIMTKRSNTEYEVDGPTYKENGTGSLVTEHHVCTKT